MGSRLGIDAYAFAGSLHRNGAGGALGFNTWQLNGQGAGRGNQIEALQRAGYFSPENPVPDVKSLGALAKAELSGKSEELTVSTEP